MHEFSTMQNIMSIVIEEAKKMGAKKISKVTVEIGELTFLGEEQMKFAFNLLKEGTIAENAELVIIKIKAKIKCKCGYKGEIRYGEKNDFHIIFPIINCPLCGNDAEILEGKECRIKSIEVET
ncbi:MAG: hydrogenase maturation nickel metallochaperone HypA [Thermoplasmatales archaeon]|nr:hydrogenase maturation nickel metallochaperone HypA [Thermoplasmatales archaeon]